MHPMRFLLLVAGLFLTGCASKYVQPEESQPHATITASSNRQAYNEGNLYAAFDDEACTEKEGFGFVVNFHKLLGDGPTTFRVAANKRIYIMSNLMISNHYNGVLHNSNCTNLVSFEPEQGKNYQAHQLRSEDGCALVIADPVINAQPPTAQLHRALNCALK